MQGSIFYLTITVLVTQGKKRTHKIRQEEAGKNAMTFGKYISHKRKEMQMTQEELATKLHVSKSAIAKWETDGGIPDRNNIKKLAEVMKVSVDELYRIIDKSDKKKEEINITSDVIAMLELYGYQIKRPGEK